MKVFQIVGGFCYYDASALYDSVASIPDGTYPPNIKFADAPDYVREGWGYDGVNFIEPIPPVGWLYDPVTGTFYEDPDYAPSEPQPDESDDMLNALTLLNVEPVEV